VTFLFVGPALAQRSGVLLGVARATTEEGADTQDFVTIHEPQYQTLWIAEDATGELKVLASLPELIVPRRDGFWHVGVKQVCEFGDKNSSNPPNESLEQVVWTAPVTKAGTVEQGQPCATHKPEDYAGRYGRSEEDQDKISQCGFELVNIRYLSPEIMSISTYSGQSEDCEPRGGHSIQDYRVRRFDSDGALDFGELLGPKARNDYTKALPKRVQSMDGEDCEPTFEDAETGWRIAHELERWRPHLHQEFGYLCSVDAPVSFPLPASLTGDSSPLLEWKLLQSRVKGVEDAYVSPSADLLIAVTHSDLKFYELRGGVPGKLLLSLPTGPIVMTQWATGTHVQDWTAQIGRLAKQHLPEPVARVKAASN